MVRSLAVSGIVLSSIVAASARSELLEMRQVIYGMDCSSCSHPLGVALQRLPGVRSVEVSLEKGEADIHFVAGNLVSVAQIQAIIQRGGFETKAVELWASGTLVEDKGHLALALGSVTYPLGPAAREAELRRAGVGRTVTIRGQLVAETAAGSGPVLVVAEIGSGSVKH